MTARGQRPGTHHEGLRLSPLAAPDGEGARAAPLGTGAGTVVSCIVGCKVLYWRGVVSPASSS